MSVKAGSECTGTQIDYVTVWMLRVLSPLCFLAILLILGRTTALDWDRMIFVAWNLSTFLYLGVMKVMSTG